MRTTLAVVAVIIAAVVVGGVASSGTAPTPIEATTTTAAATVTATVQPVPVAKAFVPDALLATGQGEVIAVEDGAVYPPWPGLIGAAGHTAISTKGNVLVWSPLGETARGVPIDGAVGDGFAAGRLVPLVTDLAERWVALGPPHVPASTGTIAGGRSSTEIAVVSPEGDAVDVVVPGNVVPEAFSLEPDDGTAPRLYALEYLPPEAPTHYRVRLLDPNTGDLSFPANLRDKASAVDTQMAGVSRDQVLATRRGVLFTLYRGNHGEDVDYAFIHTLSMWGGVWCLVVPDDLQLATTPGAIAVDPLEAMLYAVSANGSVAEYSIDDVEDPQQSPDARRTVTALEPRTERPVVAVTHDHVVVARGTEIAWLDRDDLAVVATTQANDDIDAVATVAGTDTVMIVTGDLLATIGPGESVDVGLRLPSEVVHGVTKIVPG